jgi:hypothetical protein
LALIPITIYRELGKLAPDLAAYLDARGQLYEVERPDGSVHWFVDDSLPRESEITDEIIASTVAFALFAETDEGLEFVGQYPTLVAAETAKSNAKVVISAPVIDVPDEDEWDSLHGEKAEPAQPPAPVDEFGQPVIQDDDS